MNGKRLVIVVFMLWMVIAGEVNARAETGVTATQVTMGMSTALNGAASFLGTSFKMGVEAYLNSVNETGGVHGRKIKLIAYDDGYEPKNAVTNATKLVKEDGVFGLLGNVGTPTALAIRKLLAEEKVFLFAPFTGAESLRKPVDRYLLHFRASYNQEAEVFIKGMVDVLGYRKVAVFYQDDGYGKAVLDGATLALNRRSLAPVATGTYTRNFENVNEALDRIMAARPEAVVLGGTYSACAKFITHWKRKTILEKRKEPDPVFMNVSFVGPARLSTLLDKYGNGVVVTQVVPPFSTGGANYPAVADYLAALQKYFPQTRPDPGSLEGYLATKVFVEVLMRAGKNLTREGFIGTLEGIKDLDIQAGNKISFAKDNHQGSQTVYPTVIRAGRFVPITDWNAVKPQ
jgi:ABC-type branched-subunit amino acid transport system substrate-binding protein